MPAADDDDPEVIAGMETYERLNETTGTLELRGRPFTMPVGQRRVAGEEK